MYRGGYEVPSTPASLRSTTSALCLLKAQLLTHDSLAIFPPVLPGDVEH